MATEMKPFQVAILAMFGGLALIGVIVFATYSGLRGTQGPGSVTIWGTIPQESFDRILGELRTVAQDYDAVKYVQKSSDTYESELLNALASGAGPDLIVMSQADILSKEQKILTIPFSKISERTFRNTFIDEADLFIASEGLYGVPFATDPLVMYWNRNMLATAGVARPPQYWDEFFDYALKVTKRDQTGTVTQSALALGESQNVAHAKDIFSTLLMQSGNTIVARDEKGDPRVILGNYATDGSVSAETALIFYTEFANPSKNVYSWNRSLPLSRDAFIAGQLGIYFGYASELSLIRAGNPNLNFDIAQFPKVRGGSAQNAPVTAGRMYSFALPKTGKNPQGALIVAQSLSGSSLAKLFAQELRIAPARRDLIAEGTPDAVATVFYSAALVSSGWLDPNPEKSTNIFQTMIEAVTTGRERPSEAVGNAQGALDASLKSR